MTNPNIAVKNRFMAAVFSGDAETLKSLLDPDYELHEPPGLPYAGVYRGVEGFFAFYEQFAAAFEVESAEMLGDYLGDDPDLMVLESRFRGVLKATGERFDTSVLEKWTFRDGKLLKVVVHWFETPRLPG